MDIKSAPLRVKAAGEDDGLEPGQFLAYASTFGGPPDSYGDIVDPGAFSKSLGEWEAKGDPIPLLWGHDLSNPFSNLGHIVKAEEDDHGLKVLGEFDLSNPTAEQVYRMVKGRRTTDLSFAFQTRDSEKKSDANHLKDLDLFEVSIVPIGANRLTDVLAVKHLADNIVDGLKAGRALSGKNETSLRAAHEAIGKVLSSLGEVTDDAEKANVEPVVNGEEPGAVKSEEQLVSASVARLSAQMKIYALNGQIGVTS